MYKAIDSSDFFSQSEPRDFKKAIRSIDAAHQKAAFDLEVNTCIDLCCRGQDQLLETDPRARRSQ